MNMKQYYNQVMNQSPHMALATSVDNHPNVRIVTFGYNEKEAAKLYFTTFKENQKIKDLNRNPQVACMPLPTGPETPAQVRVFGKAKPSAVTLDEVIKMISQKSPEDTATLADSGHMLIIYEVQVEEAWVTIGMAPAQKVLF